MEVFVEFIDETIDSVKKITIPMHCRTLDYEQVEVGRMEEALFQPFDSNLLLTKSAKIKIEKLQFE